MSSEVCPFCGKTYKRLKSHLPHCKAAAASKTRLTQRDVPAKETSSFKLAAASPKPTAKGNESMQTPSVTTDPQRSKKSKKVSAVSSRQLKSSTSVMSKSIPPSTNEKKQKLADQIKMANTPSSATISLISSPSLVFTKPKNKSLRASIEAAKSKQVSKESLERTRSVSEDLLLDSTSFLTDSLNTKNNPDKVTKLKDASIKNVLKIKKAAESCSKTINASDSLDGDINDTRSGNNLWVDSEGEIDDLSVNGLLMKSRGGQQGRITLQDVKATLRRAKTTSQSSTLSIVSQIETADDLSGKCQKDINCWVTATAISDQLPSSSSQQTSLQSMKKKSLSSEQASLIPLQRDTSPQPEPTSSTAPLRSGHLSSQVNQAAPLSHTFSTSEGLKVGRHTTGLLSKLPAPAQIPSPHPFLLAPPARVETRADEGSTKETLQLIVGKQNSANGRAAAGALTQRHLGQVRLRELPEWLACKAPRNPRDLVEMVQGGKIGEGRTPVKSQDSQPRNSWQWYHRRYIDVKKGGVGGLGMLLAGYCVLSYIWSYPHTKRDRWRKYH